MDSDRIVKDFCDAWGRGDLDAIMDAFADDAVYHNIPMAPLEGRHAIRGFIAGLVGGEKGGIRFDVRHQLVEGRRVMNERIDTITMGDKTVELPVMGVFELDADGQIAAWRDYFDMGQFAGG